MTKLKITNNTDHDNAIRGLIEVSQVRSVEIDALVDTGATELCLPAEVVAQLGAQVSGTRRARDATGRVVELDWVGGLRIDILGREMTCDALVLPSGAQALIGQIPLEGLDLIVDPKSRELSVNPASPDMPLLDILAIA